MSKGWRVAVLGATGLVGDTMISVLEERKFPVSELFPLASNRSLGKTVQLAGKSYPVLDVETFDFSRADIGLFSAGAEISAKYAPIAAAAGCVVIDNTSQFRYQDDIPLVVPEVNPHAIAQRAKIEVVQPTGPDTLVLIRLNGTPVTCRVHPSANPRAGETMDLVFDLSKLVYFDPQTEKRIR